MRYFIFAIYILFPVTVSAQAEKNYIRQGNREYNKGRYEESEVSYRKANEQNNRLPEIFFNIGDALYKQEKYDEAAKQFSTNAAMNEDVSKKAAGLYNLGNSYLKSGKFKESIEAYKESLRLQPNNHEAKYNLAYAQDLLKGQEQQQQQQDENKQDNNQDKNQDNQDSQQDQQNQDNQDRQDQQQQQQQRQQQQDQELSISKEDAERLLNSLANDEKEVQEKVRLEKAAQERKNSARNW